MGWLYLAKDKNVSDRLVVLKGLLNSEDADLVASAITEQRFLAQVQHPQIVEIYNFVTHDDMGYIVMEYVGGRSLKQLLKDRKEANGGVNKPLPPEQAIAFIVEVLPAFSYLHESGLLFCDFKPDNVIQVGDALKLIDLGGVRRIGDEDSAIYGTVGFQAPEVSARGPSIASDIYTIGRTLAVLVADFKGYQSTYQFSLPSPQDVPAFARFDSLYRLLLKCCAPNPQDRFMSVDELRHQLMGVLREVVGTKVRGGSQSSAASLLFTGPMAQADQLEWHHLPDLLVDEEDPAFSFLRERRWNWAMPTSSRSR
ncbi:30S ribosomal protein S14 [Platysternon megacephalum]|uniref:non-specific serine/threonine protein kinase n=1 Tax=Platysternon megacephalum TaxID=55544 RepID=A0A4D9DIY1_9SAUR|nr:30S ribosomal protein S14 [Platysternon megacephalum]